MRIQYTLALLGVLCLSLAAGSPGQAKVSAEYAQKLKTTLTPLGGEKAGNADGTIPAWDGGNTTPIPGFKNGGKRSDPFAAEKPLYAITAQNMSQYSDKLSEGVQAMLRKYPDTFRLDVYPTHRTAAAPQWVYDNTFANATRGELDDVTPKNVYGGIPFPIPQSGVEAIWNHMMRWRGTSWHMDFSGYLTTSDGKHVLMVESNNDHQMPYYIQGGNAKDWNGEYWLVRSVNGGPPIRAGEAITGREHVDPDKVVTWVYLTGQRRVRKLPQSCCDTPTPFSAGVSSFDEVDVYNGAASLTRFNWKVLGKKELYIPYNSNRSFQPTLDEMLGQHHLNPDHVRWELHRVWVVEASIKDGQRHTSPHSVYYLDEDTWIAALADRQDSKGQLWRTLFALIQTAPDIPATINTTWGFYDLLGGTYWSNVMFNGKSEQYRIMDQYPDRVFTPDAMAGEGIR